MSNTRMNSPRFIMRMEDNILFAIITIKKRMMSNAF